MTNQTKTTDASAWSRLIDHFKLSWRLFRDPTVSPLVRYGIPLLGLVYLISPVDIIPDVLLGFGQLDDAAVLLLLSQLMVMLAPDDLVAKYRQASQPPSPEPEPAAPEEEVIDADYRVISDV
jgi:uncharacterized membrane protein YkvA (DUF1232 family)